MLNQIKKVMYSTKMFLLDLFYKGMYSDDETMDMINDSEETLSSLNYQLEPFLHSKYVYAKYSDFRKEYDENKKETKRVYKLLKRATKSNDIDKNIQILLDNEKSVNALFNFCGKAECYIKTCDRKPVYLSKLQKKIYPICMKIQELELFILEIFFNLSNEKIETLRENKKFINYRQMINVVLNYKLKDSNSTLDSVIKASSLRNKLEELNGCSINALIKDFWYSVGILNEKLETANRIAKEMGYKNKLEKELKYVNPKLITKIADYSKNCIKTISFVSLTKDELLRICKNSLYNEFGFEYAKEYNKPFKNGHIYLGRNSQGCTEYMRDSSVIYIPGLSDIDCAATLVHEIAHYIDFTFNNDSIILNVKARNYFDEVTAILNEIILLEYAMKQYANKDKILYLLINKYYNDLYSKSVMAAKLTQFEVKALKKVNNNSLGKITPDEVNELLNKYIDSPYQNKNINLSNINIEDNFDEVSYIYGVLIALRIFKNIKEDSKYTFKYLDFLKISQNLTYEEKLNYFNIDLNDKTLVEDLVVKLDELYNSSVRLERKLPKNEIYSAKVLSDIMTIVNI